MATHSEGANSLTFINHDPYFLIATCYNRMAYIIKAHTGEKIDCIQQGLSTVPEPIGYRLKDKYRSVQVADKKRAIAEGRLDDNPP